MLKTNGGGICDHEVGGGKTMIMCTAAYEMKRLGLANKPMIIGLKANVSANAGSPARPAQTSRQMPGAPRGLRKRLGKCRDTCAACANVSANATELARPAQTSRQMPRNLRGLRKRGTDGGMLLCPYSLTANRFTSY